MSGQRLASCDPLLTPADLSNRLKLFRRAGCDALLAHLLVAGSLTWADR